MTSLAEVGSIIAEIAPAGTVSKTIYLPASDIPLGLAPGDRVNVFFTYQPDGASGLGTTTLLVDDALVAWVGEMPADGMLFSARPPYYNPTPTPVPPDAEIPVVLLVSDQDSAELIWAEQHQLPLSLVIRSARSTSSTSIVPVVPDALPR